MNATSAARRAADEDDEEDDEDGEAADMEGTVSRSRFSSKQAVIPLVLQLMLPAMLSFQNMRKVACWKQMR